MDTTILVENKSLEESLTQFVQNNEWQKILQLSESYSLEETSKYLWAWPTEKCIEFIKLILLEYEITNILSIGCGSGLLEYIIQAATNVSVTGLELDKSWWTSNYSPKSFIKLKFTNSKINSEFLHNCIFENNDELSQLLTYNKQEMENIALLFCYFNNRKSFCEYVNAFTGNFIFIIGPKKGHNIYCDPDPMEPHFEKNSQYFWHLEIVHEIKNSFNNIITLYKRKQYL